jgi:hypothetical protein
LPGILASDERQAGWLQAAGYRAVRRRRILQQPLSDFRPPVNRQLMLIRRQYRLETSVDPRPVNWWEASARAHHELTCFRLLASTDGQPAATALFWDMEPLASSWGMHAAGLLSWETVTKNAAPEGLDVYLLGESFRQLQTQAVTLVEAHLDEEDQARQQFLTGLGFAQVDTGVVFHKQL